MIKRRYKIDFVQPNNPEDENKVTGYLPKFFKPLGFDFIITEDKKIYLIELQHGFGRQGMMELYPNSLNYYRKMVRLLRNTYGKGWPIAKELRKICSNKTNTYNLLKKYQPKSFHYRSWNHKIESWLNSLEHDFILAKPPKGSCGVGILIFTRDEFYNNHNNINLGSARLLQEYIPSKYIYDNNNQPHIGCIRHVVMLLGDEQNLNFVHIPSYWRVSPEPYFHKPNPEVLTANISRGAYPVKLDQDEEFLVQRLTEIISKDLLCQILNINNIDIGKSIEVPLTENYISVLSHSGLTLN